MILGALHARLRSLESVAARALPRAAARIEAKLRADSTTGRGNVPAYGDFGAASSARVEGDAVVVTAAGWVHDAAEKRGQPDEWRGILAGEVQYALEEDR